jgi:hypothetical protein
VPGHVRHQRANPSRAHSSDGHPRRRDRGRKARELAIELHDIVAECVKLYRADKRRLVEYPDDDPEREPIVLEALREPNALELADFRLAVWRQALRDGAGDDPNGLDYSEGAWISEVLVGLCDEDLFMRRLTVCDFIQPCCGNGFFVRQLKRAGHVCLGTFDLPDDARTMRYDIPENTVFVTNPPFWVKPRELHPLIENLSNQAPAWLLMASLFNISSADPDRVQVARGHRGRANQMDRGFAIHRQGQGQPRLRGLLVNSRSNFRQIAATKAARSVVSTTSPALKDSAAPIS